MKHLKDMTLDELKSGYEKGKVTDEEIEQHKKEIKLKVSSNNEGTESPYWLILDPRQMMSPDCHTVASMITGPFFSRESAENHLSNRRYAFGKNAVVYCCSGYWSFQYKNALRNAEHEYQKLKDNE